MFKGRHFNRSHQSYAVGTMGSSCWHCTLFAGQAEGEVAASVIVYGIVHRYA